MRGSGGGLLRGYPCQPIEKYIDQISSEGKQIKGYGEEFYILQSGFAKEVYF